MPFHIEIQSLGGDFNALIEEAAQLLNGVQREFIFALAPQPLRAKGAGYIKSNYVTHEVFEFLQEYRTQAKGDRRYLIGIIAKPLQSKRLGNLFASREARKGEGEAVVTLCDHEVYTDSPQLYLCYYFIRYALSFVCPSLKNHDDTRACFFDRKIYKPDLAQSIDSGSFCDECRSVLWGDFNEEINLSIQSMVGVMKSLRADSEAILDAASLQGQVDIGIITIREDEYEAVLNRLSSWRHVDGKASNYSFAKVPTKSGEELRIAVARSPEQGMGAAQALASNMITELGPKWIFVVGIAGGIPASEYTLGDVLLSQRMHDFAVSAAAEGKSPEFQDMGGPMAIEVEKLVTSLKGRRGLLGDWSSKESLGKAKPPLVVPGELDDGSLYGSEGWRQKIVESLTRHFPADGNTRDPEFFAAVIISSNTLVKDTELASIWGQTARHASGVEMELGGVCRAARNTGDGTTRVLAIRGLSDVIGYRRSHDWTEYACRTAAGFADALIRSGMIKRS